MILMKYQILLIFTFLLGGCVKSPDRITANIQTSLNIEKSLNLLDEFIQKCWTKKGGLWSDYLYAKKSMNGDSYVYTLGRDNSDIRFSPFATIEVRNNDKGVSYVISEGKTIMWKNWNVEESLNTWLAQKGNCGK